MTPTIHMHKKTSKERFGMLERWCWSSVWPFCWVQMIEGHKSLGGKMVKKNKVKLFWMFDSGFYGHYNILIYIYILYVPLFWTCLACTVWNHDQLVRSQTGLVQGSKDWQAEIPWGFSALGGEITSGVMCVGYTPRPTRKTKMTMEHPPLQDVFPIGNGDLPMSC